MPRGIGRSYSLRSGQIMSGHDLLPQPRDTLGSRIGNETMPGTIQCRLGAKPRRVGNLLLKPPPDIRPSLSDLLRR